MTFEYKVVPAPTKGLKARGVKSGAFRFANALETQINELAADGWEYLRADTLPFEEREGLMGKTTSFQNMLVFRRAVVEEAEEVPVDEPKALPAPEPEYEPEPELEASEPMPDVTETAELGQPDDTRTTAA